MLNRKLPSRQRRKQINRHLRPQVRILPLEPLVRLLLNNDDNVPGYRSRCLIALARKRDVLATLHPFVDMYFQHFLLLHCLLPAAALAPVLVVNDLACTVTIPTRLLDLLDHRAHLAHNYANTTTTTRRASPHRALLPTTPIAFLADDVARECEFGRLALVKVFESDVHAVDEVFALLRTCLARRPSAEEAATSAKELGEEVLLLGRVG